VVTSSDEERCLMSAESNLAGLYPPTPQEMWNSTLNWQPIPIHTKPRFEDKVSISVLYLTFHPLTLTQDQTVMSQDQTVMSQYQTVMSQDQTVMSQYRDACMTF